MPNLKKKVILYFENIFKICHNWNHDFPLMFHNIVGVELMCLKLKSMLCSFKISSKNNNKI